MSVNDLDHYEAAIIETFALEFTKHAFYDHARFSAMYTALGLSEEAGEVLGKIKKAVRDDGWEPGLEMSTTRKALIITEIGDLFFYAFQLLKDIGASPIDALDSFLIKAEGRKERGTLHGDGDDR